ncbi:MAG TPA: type III-B CRISPR module-associated protein Cmr5 [Ghiorsea sp.]|nr:type III-B CRISPR module-associated protein Cmr5 [Ghiorsea sp.]
MNDIDQQRANHALKEIQNLKTQGYNTYGKYVSYVKALPATILQIGLGQALATEFSSSGNDNDTGKGHDCLFKSLCNWLGRNEKEAPYSNTAMSFDGILAALTNGTQEEYTYAQYEAIAYLDWLKKFAVALLEQDNPANSTGDSHE